MSRFLIITLLGLAGSSSTRTRRAPFIGGLYFVPWKGVVEFRFAPFG
jgi:hypothetical protein